MIKKIIYILCFVALVAGCFLIIKPSFFPDKNLPDVVSTRKTVSETREYIESQDFSSLPVDEKADMVIFQSIDLMNQFGSNGNLPNAAPTAKEAITILANLIQEKDLSPYKMAYANIRMYEVYIHSCSNPVVMDALYAFPKYKEYYNNTIQKLRLNDKILSKNDLKNINFIVTGYIADDANKAMETRHAYARKMLAVRTEYIAVRDSKSFSKEEKDLAKQNYVDTTKKLYDSLKKVNTNNEVDVSKFFEAEGSSMLASALQTYGLITQSTEYEKDVSENYNNAKTVSKANLDKTGLPMIGMLAFLSEIAGTYSQQDVPYNQRLEAMNKNFKEYIPADFLTNNVYGGVRNYLVSQRNTGSATEKALIELSKKNANAKNILNSIGWAL